MLHSILSYLDIAADIYNNRTAYTDGSDKIRFAQLKRAASSIGTAVATAEKAERPVAVLTGRHVYTPACYLGIAMAGCFYAPMDPGVPDSRLRQILDVAKPDTLIADREHAEKAGELGYTGRLIIMEEAMETAADEAVLAERRKAITETSPLYILFTSGSTGKPKGVLTSHQAVICYLDGLQEVIGLNEMPTEKKIKADLSDGMLLEVNDLTGAPTTDKYGEPHDYRDDYPNRTVIGIYDITLWSADHRAVTLPEEPFTVRIRCSQPDAKVYEAGYYDDLNAVYENGWLVFSVDRITRFAVVAGADVVLPVCGDIDGDGELSVYDVTIIQRYEAGMTVKSDAEMILHADVNGDGATDVFDATYVQRYLASMDSPHPAGEKF